MKIWNVTIAGQLAPFDARLLALIGFVAPYINDHTNEARVESEYSQKSLATLMEAHAYGLTGDAAAMMAIRLQNERNAAQRLETARQKVAEIEAQVAADNKVAAMIASAMHKRVTG